MDLTFKIRQARSFRTRIQYPGLRHQADCCAHIRDLLTPLKGVENVEVRPRSGSIVLVHPDHPLDINRVTGLVASGAAELENLAAGSPAVSGSPFSPPAYHVSGLPLLASGLYIGWLLIRRIMAPIAPAASLVYRVVSIPGLVALWLARPIQRQAVDNFKSTGRIDMSFVSTGLLYLSLFTGNVVTALAVAWLYNLSGWTESRVRQHTRRLVREMLTGRQAHAWKLVNGAEVKVDAASLLPGDTIVLAQGNSVPVDGTVVLGTALVNEAAMTGESMPRIRAVGQTVLAGTLVEDGSVRVRVDKTGEDTRLAAIVRLIESAQNDLGDMGRASVKFSRIMVPVSLGLASVVFLMTGSLFTAITTIMVTCPCALRLSTSAAVSTAMGRAAARGILIKGGSQVETAGRVDTLVLDKTGTLTDSVARVTEIHPIDRRYREKTILGLAASTLQTGNHPLSRAVVREAFERGVELPACLNRRHFVGRGVEARIQGRTGEKTIIAGSGKFMAERGLDPAGSAGPSGSENIPESLVYVANANRLLGCIHAGHVIRKDATPDTMNRLRQMGVSHIVMLTGDTREGTRELVKRLAFDDVIWGMSPEDKAAWVTRHRTAHPDAVVAVVGDGINDTPAFSKSHLSFAVGEAGEDLTLEYADIVLQQGGIGAVADTLAQGRESLAVLRQSYAIAIGLNVLTMGLMLTGIFSPLAGALAHNLITLTAVANAAGNSG